MTDHTAAIRQALEAPGCERLKDFYSVGPVQRAAVESFADALDAELAKVQEPVAVYQFRKQCCADWFDGRPDETDGGGPYEMRTLYTAPPAPAATVLTDEEIVRAIDSVSTYSGSYEVAICRAAIEAAILKGQQ